MRGSESLAAALTGVTAAVVGVIANLALFFAVHTLFAETRTVDRGPVELLVPVWSSYVWEAFCVGAVAMVLVFGLRWSVLRDARRLCAAGSGAHRPRLSRGNDPV